MSPAIQIGDFVRVVSKDDRDWKFSWDSRPYPLPAGGTVMMPFECAALWFGDPRAAENVVSIKNEQGLVSWVGDRATEVRRLRTKYDNQFGDENEIINAPNVEVYDMEDNRIHTVLDDPLGEGVISAHTTVSSQSDLLAQVQRQSRLIDMLMKQQGMDPNADPNSLITQPTTTNPADPLAVEGDPNAPLTEHDGTTVDPADAPTVEGAPAIPEDHGTAPAT